MVAYKEDSFGPDELLLDPNNYRFQELDDFRFCPDERICEDAVQLAAFNRLKDEALDELKSSILSNGYIPIERILVRPYLPQKGKFVVVEGNRRVAAVKWLLRDSETGVDVDGGVLETVRSIPAVVSEGDSDEDKIFRASLMGVRHVTGIKQWGGYQRSKLIVQLKDELGLEFSDIHAKIGMSTRAVKRRYRAFKALEQMQDDDEYEAYAKPHQYPLFHEALAIPAVRNWLGWNEETWQFEDADERSKFYEMISPKTDNEGNVQRAKLSTYWQVRNLSEVMANAKARRALMDPNRSYEEAYTIVLQERLKKDWLRTVEDAIEALNSFPVSVLKGLSVEELAVLKRLADAVKERLDDYDELKPS